MEHSALERTDDDRLTGSKHPWLMRARGMPATNAGLEAVNAVIQWVKKTARGFRNPVHFKIAIYFH